MLFSYIRRVSSNRKRIVFGRWQAPLYSFPVEKSRIQSYVHTILYYPAGTQRWNNVASTGTVAQLVERPLCDREVAGSIPGRLIPKTKNGISCYFAWRSALTQLAFYVNLHRAVIGPSATLTGRWRPDIDLRRMLTGKKGELGIRTCQLSVSIVWLGGIFCQVSGVRYFSEAAL